MEARRQRLSHLEHLAEELAGQGFHTELAGKGAKPYLKVANASTPELNERVHCEQADDGSWAFWWPWHRPIGPADDLKAAAGKIAVVLRPVEAEQ